MIECNAVSRYSNHSNLRRWSMGDKSPKANDRKKKQHDQEKTQKKSDAFNKAHPSPMVPGKKGK